MSGQVKTLPNGIDTSLLVRALAGEHVCLDRKVGIKSVVSDGGSIRIKLTDSARQIPLTQERYEAAQDSIRKWCGKPQAKVKFYTSEIDLSQIATPVDKWQGGKAKGSPVRRTDIGYGGAMEGRTIAMWASHGRYYEKSLNRWEWQRARLYTTVEDLLTPSFVYPFLMPMLENAGAVVLSPRERDTTSVRQVMTVGDAGFTSTTEKAGEYEGYAECELKAGVNPFKKGKTYAYRLTETDSLSFTGKAEVTGRPMVYIAYKTEENSSDKVEVIIRTKAEEAHYEVNQRMGGQMWMPLGFHTFKKGEKWSVTLKGEGLVTASAVRIGGGYGRVERGGSTSGLPAWAECAKYYLQEDGFDYEKVVNLSGADEKDYTDDLNGRGEWVNALVTDKNIPVEMSLALHTDAGVTWTDSTIGTLALVTTKRGKEKTFPDGTSRSISRHLASIVTESVIRDIRATWDKDWTSRGIADKGYAESRRPDVPALLLELLAHQNLADMRCALHPAFRHDAARAVYKGILRYLCGVDAAVAPLAPQKFGIDREADGELRLRWSATIDELEATAVSKKYIVYDGYKPIGETQDTTIRVSQKADGKIHTYHVVAVGDGGRSMPSESLSACIFKKTDEVSLLVEGMDRLSSPDIIQTGAWNGLLTGEDRGVAWDGDIYTTGDQYDYNPAHEWLDDDSPGCGASYADREMKHISGSHRTEASDVAKLMHDNGLSYISQSKEYFDGDTMSRATYPLVRIALERQRTTWYGDMKKRHSIYTRGFQKRLTDMANAGQKVVISGSYVGTDATNIETKKWCQKTLGFLHRTSHATMTLKFNVSRKWLKDNNIAVPSIEKWGGTVAADAIEPVGKGAKTVVRYDDSVMSAGVAKGNILVVGF